MGVCPSSGCVAFGRMLNISDPHQNREHSIGLRLMNQLTARACGKKGGNARARGVGSSRPGNWGHGDIIHGRRGVCKPEGSSNEARHTL